MREDEQEKDAQRILLAALECDSPAEREAYVVGVCGRDSTLREAVTELLRDYDESGDGGTTRPLVTKTAPEQGESSSLVPGKVLAERYRIVSMLGRGGMGEVYRADDLKLKQRVALKFLPVALGGDAKLLEALHNEVRHARRVTHRHVTRVYDIGEAEGLHFLSMEFIEGENLGSLLRRIGKLPVNKALELGQELCSGLLAAHEEGLLHLDLKPANLMIDERGQLRITDFGLARLTKDAEAETRRAGTPAYMAPEQLLLGEASTQSDIYAVGLILHEMFTGTCLHARRSLEEIISWHQSRESSHPLSLSKAVPGGLEPLITKCLERDLAQRPDSIKAVLSELRSSVITPPTTPADRGSAAPGKQLAALMFTDLVGSVDLQRRLGTEAYKRFLSRHDDVFNDCLRARSNALILNETGDGFLVRFDDPSDAVNTALELQYRLNQETVEGEPISIRIGLHLGVVTEMEERIRGERRAVGMPINLTARIMDLAGGGQILMTRAVYDDARNYVREHPMIEGEPLKVPLIWQSHGDYEFKGNPEPLEIFEVGAEGLAPLVAPEDSGKGKRAGSSASISVSTADLQVLPPEQVKGSDVFIAYSPVDNKPLTSGSEGWITQFHKSLELRLEQLAGEPVKVWRETLPLSEERTAKIIPFLSEVKTMVSVVSPPFMKSTGCLQGVEEFLDKAVGDGKQPVQERPRLLKAVKSPVPIEEFPPHLIDAFSRLTDFDFFESDPDTGRLHEYDEAFGEVAQQHFFERIYDLAYEIREVLKALKHGSGISQKEAPGGKTVYLAECTSGMQSERDELKRELLELGHRVIPTHPLPLTGPELETAVCEYLAEAHFAVHLVGNRYGLIPEDAEQSVVEIQNRLAAEHSADDDRFERLIWMARDVEPRDDRQAAFLRALSEDPELHRGGEVIQDTIENLKQLLLEKLAPKEESEDTIQTAGSSPDGPPVIYVICDQRDEDAIEPLEDHFFDHGFEVQTPHFEGDEAEVSQMHRNKLMHCDGVLVYYGAASKAWVETKLMDVVQSPGYGRTKPMKAQAVYVAPPEDRRKARFRTHVAEVIHHENAEWDPAVLESFVARMKEGNGDD